jgi:GTPase-associated protein 1, N-terminal domain type 1
MNVDQAFYGVVQGGHGLLLASRDVSIAHRLGPSLDLPDTAPPGVPWSPFLRGFSFGENYILARTILDTSAPRPGMVFSHALIAPLEELVSISDLRPLLALLVKKPQCPDATGPVQIESLNAEVPSTSDLLPTFEQLVRRGSGPVVRVGLEGFDDLIVALWARLWPEIRRGFAFRLSFGPNDLAEQPLPAVVCTPTNLAARWTGLRVVNESVGTNTESLAASLITGNSAGHALLAFGRRIGAKLTNFGELVLLEQAFTLQTERKEPFESMVSSLRMVERLSQDPTAGVEEKERLVKQLDDLLRIATAPQVLLLRNLTLAKIPQSIVLWDSLRSWVAKNPFAPSEDANILSLFEDATTSAAAVPEWQRSVLEGLAEAARFANPEFPRAFWRWEDMNPEIGRRIFASIPADPSVDLRLAQAIPNGLSQEVAETIMKLSSEQGRLILHAGVASAAFEPIQSLRLQLQIDRDPQWSDAIRMALRHASSQQVLASSIEFSDARLIRMAAELVASDPKLIGASDLSLASVQTIWTIALRQNPEAWAITEDPKNAFWKLLDTLLDGTAVNSELIFLLSGSQLADLSRYSRRSQIWTRVPPPSRDKLLAATSVSWLERATNGNAPFPLEPELQTFLLNGKELYAKLDALVPSRIGDAIRLVSSLDQFTEVRFQSWLADATARSTRFETADVEAIGYLLLGRKWINAANQLADSFSRGRRDVQSAVRICYDLLGRWRRFRLGVVPLSPNEKWQLLEEICVQLYPYGPDQDELWHRAGGSNSDLTLNGTGRSRWYDALLKIRRGNLVRPYSLLGVMRKEYSANDELRYLSEDYEFRAR